MLQGQVPQINTESIHPYYENNSINSNDLFNIGNIILSSIDTNHYEDGDKIICFDALTTEELLYSTSSSASYWTFLNGTKKLYNGLGYVCDFTYDTYEAVYGLQSKQVGETTIKEYIKKNTT